MGWCSGTQVFDDVAEQILSDKPLDKKEILVAVIDALQSMDWDCESDSMYWDHPLVREIFTERHPEWFDDEEDYE